MIFNSFFLTIWLLFVTLSMIASDCMICLEKLSFQQKLQLPCKHTLHKKCCDQYFSLPDQETLHEERTDHETGESFTVPIIRQNMKQCPECRFNLGSRQIYQEYVLFQSAIQKKDEAAALHYAKNLSSYLNRDGLNHLSKVQQGFLGDQSLSPEERKTELNRRMRNVRYIKNVVIHSLCRLLRQQSDVIKETRTSADACEFIISNINRMKRTLYYGREDFRDKMKRTLTSHLKHVSNLHKLVNFERELDNPFRAIVKKRINELTKTTFSARR